MAIEGEGLGRWREGDREKGSNLSDLREYM